MRAPIMLMRSSCKMDADFSSPIASNATPFHLSPNIREMNGHISLAVCPAAPICPPASRPPLSPTCAPRRLRATNCHPGRSRRHSWHLVLSLDARHLALGSREGHASSERQIDHNVRNFLATYTGSSTSKEL